MSNLPIPKQDDAANSDIIQLVSFELNNEEYGVDVLAVREIIRLPSITKMPNAPHYVDGIINLRGIVVPVISLRRRFGLCDGETSMRSRILVMETSAGLNGFIVDAVAEVIRISTCEIQPAPMTAHGNVDQDYISGVVKHGDRLLIVLDLVRLFHKDEQPLLCSAP